MQLSKTERLILANQYRILEAVDSANADRYRKNVEILTYGYEGELDSLIDWIFDPFPAAECDAVVDILEMYSALQRSVGPERRQELVFPGFDGNHERSHMYYAQFVRAEHRFTDLITETKDGNSHRRMLERYRAMLAVWKGCRERFQLSNDDVSAILAAK